MQPALKSFFDLVSITKYVYIAWNLSYHCG